MEIVLAVTIEGKLRYPPENPEPDRCYMRSSYSIGRNRSGNVSDNPNPALGYPALDQSVIN